MNTRSIRHGVQLALWTIVSAFGISSPAWSSTYYVDATKGNDLNSGISEISPWKTIAKINNSTFNPGDQILLKRGETWTGTPLTVPSDGADGNPVTVGAYGIGNKPVIDGTGLSKTIYLNGRSFINIDGIEIRKGDIGIFITPSATNGQITLADCAVHSSVNNNAISIKDRGNVTIDGCTIYGSGGNGVAAYTSNTTGWSDRKGHHVKVLGSKIFDNAKSGLFVYGDNAVVRNNEFYGNGSGDSGGLYHNVYLSGDNALVERNILRDAVYGDGLRFLGSNLAARYNLFHHNRKHGMGIWNDYPETHSSLIISYNLFVQRDYPETPVSLPLAINVDTASGAGSFSGIRIYQNSVYGENDNANGFSFRKCSNVDVRNNILHLRNAYLMGVLEGASATSDYNLFKSDKSKPFAAGTEAAFSQWQGWGYDPHSIWGDSHFTDPAVSNLTLQPDSPGVGAGQNLGQAYDDGLHPSSAFPNAVTTLDQDGFGNWEMGAYVYQSGQPPAAPKNVRVE